MGTSDVEVLVIGAGAMGSATAWWLARRGVEVALVEQFEPGHARGSSHGGSRIFRLAYAEPHYVELALEAFDLWREVESDTGEVLLELTGGVDHGRPVDVAPVADALERAGRVVERLSATVAGERWPGLRFDELVVHSPDTGRLPADRCVAALQRRAAELGAYVRFGCPVVRLDVARRIALTAGGEELRASRAVVVTAGAWVTKLVGDSGSVDVAGALPPITVTKEQTFHFAPAIDDMWPAFIHYRSPVAIYGLETPGEGVKVAEHGSGVAVDPDTRSFDVDAAGRARVMSYVAEWLPGLRPSPLSEATCLYTNTPDSSFVLDRRGDVVIGSACSGHGFKFAPAIGKRLADLALS